MRDTTRYNIRMMVMKRRRTKTTNWVALWVHLLLCIGICWPDAATRTELFPVYAQHAGANENSWWQSSGCCSGCLHTIRGSCFILFWSDRSRRQKPFESWMHVVVLVSWRRFCVSDWFRPENRKRSKTSECLVKPSKYLRDLCFCFGYCTRRRATWSYCRKRS